VDFLRGVVHVRRQVKILSSRQVLALPKGRKVRDVPLPESVALAVAAHLADWPAVSVSLPWESVGGQPVAVRLLLSTRERGAVERNYFNAKVWKPALVQAGVEPTRENGTHALRHFYASVLLDAGESIRALADYLGHADPGFTLRTYTHLMPSSEERTRKAVDRALGEPGNTVDGLATA
jgi:integrase